MEGTLHPSWERGGKLLLLLKGDKSYIYLQLFTLGPLFGE
jgi:hypothetical protein